MHMPNVGRMELTVDPATQPGCARTCVSLNCDSCAMLGIRDTFL